MRTHRVVAGIAVTVVAVALAGGTAGHAQQDPASRAVAYLLAQQGPDGSVAGDAGATEDAVLGAVAAGYDPALLRHDGGPSALDYLRAQVGPATSSAGRTGKLLLAVTAARLDPHAFAGRDLVATLDATYDASTGAYGDGSTFGQALAVLGLVAAGQTPPAKAVSTLVALQDADGGWSTAATKDSAESDTNSTAVALMALGAAGDRSRDASGLDYLRTQQNADGGFPYQNPSPYGTGSDPDSTALVVQAVAGAGQDPAGAAWSVSGHSAYAALTGMQDGGTGGFGFGGAAPDPFTTSQVPAGLEMRAFPVVTAWVAGSGVAEQDARARAAVRYLASGQGADGSVAGDPGATEDTVLGASAAGFDPRTLRQPGGASAIDYLAAQVGAATSTPGRTGKLVLAVTASRLDPHAFAGHDLVADLQATYDASTGAYGDGSVFGQSLAMLGLDAAGVTPPGPAVSHLRSLQDGDGGWSTAATKDAAESDTNSTAVALMALAASGDHAADAAALAYLRTQQNSDGGFPYQNPSPYGTGSDPDSDALVLQALVAARQDPAEPAWSRGGATVVSDLLAMQDGVSGGFGFGGASPDAFTSSQVPAGIERAAFPVTPRWAAGTSPEPAGAGSATQVPAPTPTPTASVPAAVPPRTGGSHKATPTTGSTGTSSSGSATTPAPASTATPQPAPTVAPPLTAGGAPTPTAAPTPATGAGAVLPPAGGDGFPAWAVYVLAGAGGAALVVVAARLLTLRRGGAAP